MTNERLNAGYSLVIDRQNVRLIDRNGKTSISGVGEAGYQAVVEYAKRLGVMSR